MYRIHHLISYLPVVFLVVLASTLKKKKKFLSQIEK